jgi:hypothetical protein
MIEAAVAVTRGRALGWGGFGAVAGGAAGGVAGGFGCCAATAVQSPTPTIAARSSILIQLPCARSRNPSACYRACNPSAIRSVLNLRRWPGDSPKGIDIAVVAAKLDESRKIVQIQNNRPVRSEIAVPNYNAAVLQFFNSMRRSTEDVSARR